MKCFRRFALRIFCPTPSLFVRSVSGFDWFVASSHEFDENKQLDHESTIHFPLVTNVFHSYFIKAIDHSFYGFTAAINHMGY